MTGKGKIVFTLLILGVLGFGAWKWWDRLKPGAARTTQSQSSSSPAQPGAPTGTPSTPQPASKGGATKAIDLVETQTERPKLANAGIYEPKNGVVEMELSEYAGYSGLIVANGG